MTAVSIKKPPGEKRVVVAMSGGVDSSVAAALMVEQGYDVVGVTLQLYDHGEAIGRSGSCCAGQDIYDARRVADQLGIPHYVLDYERRFHDQVIESFADSYVNGETPIPCVNCNQGVKFTDLLGMARDLGADALVTGHYARWRQGPFGAELHCGADPTRDQTYFLFATTPEQLAFLRFPLGDRGKAETRSIARRLGLTVAEKADSQDICFVPNGGYARVVERLRPEGFRPGTIVDGHGAVLGRHEGIAHFTVGQRRGLGIAADKPLYVVRLEPESARVVVGPKEALLRDRIRIHRVNWLGDRPLTGDGQRLDVKVRSMMPAVCATVSASTNAGEAEVCLDEPLAGIAPGQGCVFYHGDRVLGGGWISRG